MKLLGLGFAIFLACGMPATAGDATLILRIPGLTNAIPQVLDIETGQPVNNGTQSGDWTYELDFGEGQLNRRLKLTVSGAPNMNVPSGLLIHHPFFRKGDLLLVLSPLPDADGGSDAVRRLWGTSIKDMSSDNLPEFYQRAKLAAEYRMSSLAGQWYKTHDYDVQSVFKYLESVIALSKELYIVPPDDVFRGRDWLSSAVANAASAVSSGVGLANAQKLVQDIDQEEGARFGLLWNEIKALTPCERRKPYLDAYRAAFLDIPSDQRRERVLEVTRVPFAAVESGIAQCIATAGQKAAASGTPEDKEAAKTKIIQQIESLENAREKTGIAAWIKKLTRDILDLNNILSAL